MASSYLVQVSVEENTADFAGSEAVLDIHKTGSIIKYWLTCDAGGNFCYYYYSSLYSAPSRLPTQKRSQPINGQT